VAGIRAIPACKGEEQHSHQLFIAQQEGNKNVMNIES